MNPRRRHGDEFWNSINQVRAIEPIGYGGFELGERRYTHVLQLVEATVSTVQISVSGVSVIQLLDAEETRFHVAEAATDAGGA